MQKTFAANTIQKIIIASVQDDLEIHGWDQAIVEVNADADPQVLEANDGTLTIQGSAHKLTLNIPFETEIQAQAIYRNVQVDAIRNVALDDIRKKVSINNIQGNVNLTRIADDVILTAIKGIVTIGEIRGSLSIDQATTVRILERVHDDAKFANIERLEARTIRDSVDLHAVDDVEISSVGDSLTGDDFGTLRVRHIGDSCTLHGERESQVILGRVGDSLYVQHVSKLQVERVGDHCQITESPQIFAQVGYVGDNLIVDGASQLIAGRVGDKSQIRNVQGKVEIGSTGSELKLNDVAGDVEIGRVGGNAVVQNVAGSAGLGRVGGNLTLQANFPVDSVSRFSVGGNATITLPSDADLAIRAITGGSVHGQDIQNIQSRHTVLIYGKGAAQVEVSAGGNLQLNGDTAPTSIETDKFNALNSDDWKKHRGDWRKYANDWKAFAGEWEDWKKYKDSWDWEKYKDDWKHYADGWEDWSKEDWRNFEHEMRNFGREMADLGQQIAQKVTATVNDAISSITVEPVTDEEEGEHTGKRVLIRINDREWRMDQERVNRIIEQAQQAAAEGIQNAQEAVSQALQNLNVALPHPPAQPIPPIIPPKATDSETAVDTDNTDKEQGSVATEEASKVAAARTPEEIEKERVAILHMIAEGRISPEEGDMLLEALGQ